MVTRATTLPATAPMLALASHPVVLGAAEPAGAMSVTKDQNEQQLVNFPGLPACVTSAH